MPQTENGTDDDVHKGKLSPSAIPYIIVGTVGISLFILALFCFYRQIRDICCCCSSCGHRSDVAPRQVIYTSYMPGSVSRTNSLDRIETRAPLLPASTAPPPPSFAPAPPTYEARTQNNNPRTRLPPISYTTPTPSRAPPAAKQVAKTATIIGKILTFDGGRRGTTRKK